MTLWDHFHRDHLPDETAWDDFHQVTLNEISSPGELLENCQPGVKLALQGSISLAESEGCSDDKNGLKYSFSMVNHR